MARSLTIGRFARLVDMTPRMLRRYDRLGILRPAQVDPATGYRYYSYSQVPLAETVRLMRSLDVPLGEIRAALSGSDREAVRRLLATQRERVERHIEEDRRALRRLDCALSRKGGPLDYPCALRRQSAEDVISVRFRTSLEALDGKTEQALATLDRYARRHGEVAVDREVLLYHMDPERDSDLDVEVCLPLARLLPESGTVRSHRLEGGKFAFTRHEGPYDDIRAAYCALIGWIIEQGLMTTGPERERYVVDYRDTDEPRRYVTDICWPVAAGNGETP